MSEAPKDQGAAAPDVVDDSEAQPVVEESAEGVHVKLSVLRVDGLQQLKGYSSPAAAKKGKKPAKGASGDDTPTIAVSVELSDLVRLPQTEGSAEAVPEDASEAEQALLKGKHNFDSAVFEGRWPSSDKTLDTLCCQTLTVNVLRVVAGQEDAEVIGKANVSLQPLLEGFDTFSGWFDISETAPVDQEDVAEEASEDVTEQEKKVPARVYLDLALDTPLTTESEAESFAVVTVTVTGMNPVPEEWAAAPAEDENDTADSKKKGKKTPAKSRPKSSKAKGKGKGAVEEPEQPANQYGFSLTVPVSESFSKKVSGSTSDLVEIISEEERALREAKKEQEEKEATEKASKKGAAKKGGKKTAVEEEVVEENAPLLPHLLEWNTSQQIYFSRSNLDKLIESVQRGGDTSGFLLDVNRSSLKEDGEEDWLQYVPDDKIGQAEIDLSPLLVPGTTRLEGSFAVHLHPSYVIKAQASVEDREKALAAAAASSTGDGNEDAALPSSNAIPVALDTTDIYSAKNSKVNVTIEFSKALVPLPEKPAPSIGELVIPHRVSTPETPCVEEELSSSLDSTINQLAIDFAALLDATADDANMSATYREKLFLFHLNESGKYQTMRETLKPVIVRLVREHFRVSGRDELTEADRQHLLSEVYAYLMNQVRVELVKKSSSSVDESASGEKHSGSGSATPTERATQPLAALGIEFDDLKLKCSRVDGPATNLKNLAEDAYMHEDWDSAETYFKDQLLILFARYDRLALEGEVDTSLKETHGPVLGGSESSSDDSKSDSDGNQAYAATRRALVECLVAYAKFSIEASKLDAARTALHEALVLNPLHQKGLLLLVALLVREHNFNPSAVSDTVTGGFVRHVVSSYPEDAGFMSLRGAFYEVVGDEKKTLRSFQAARRMLREEDASASLDNVFLLLSRTFYECNLFDMALKYHKRVEKHGDSTEALNATAQLLRRSGQHQEAAACVQKVIDAAVDAGAALPSWSILGHIRFDAERDSLAKGDTGSGTAREAYEVYFEWEPVETDPLACVRLASIYLAEGEWSSARDILLQLCQTSPTSFLAWSNVGRASLALDDLDAAEKAFSHANQLNRRQSSIWGYLAIVCLRKGELSTAEKCVSEGSRVGSFDEDLALRISSLFAAKGHLESAISVLGQKEEQSEAVKERLAELRSKMGTHAVPTSPVSSLITTNGQE